METRTLTREQLEMKQIELENQLFMVLEYTINNYFKLDLTSENELNAMDSWIQNELIAVRSALKEVQ